MPADSSTLLYTPTATFHEETYLPTDLTRSFSARYNTPVQAALDNTAWLRALVATPMKLDLQSAANLGFSYGIGPDTARFVYVSGARYGWLQADTTDGGGLVWHIDVPERLKVTGVTAYVRGNDGGAGHGGALPQFVPSLIMIRQPLDGSAGTLIHSADDPSTGGTYDAFHTIQITGINEQFAASQSEVPGEQCIIGLNGESGTGAVNECFKLFGIDVFLGFA
jgi:hypothetical protein